MSLSNEYAIHWTTGAGNQGPYAFTLDYDDSDEIKGISQKADGTITEHAQQSLDEENQTVTFTSNVVSGAKLAIYRDTPQTQSEEFRRRGEFGQDRHDNAIDKSFHVLQRLWQRMEGGATYRNVKDFDPTLPYDLTQEADGGIQVNALGTGLQIVDDIQLIVDASDEATAAGASASAAAISASKADAYDTQAVASAATTAANAEPIEDAAQYVDCAINDLGAADGNADIGQTCLVDLSSGDRTVTLRNMGLNDGHVTVKNKSPIAGKVTIIGTQSINDNDTVIMHHPYQSITFARRGNLNSWHIIADDDESGHDLPPYLRSTGDNALDAQTSMEVVPRRGGHGWIVCEMPDGKLWHNTDGVLTVDLDTNGELGLDTGSIAADTFYYVYMVPKSGGGWRELTAICSATGPISGGPDGYADSDWRYVGSFRTGVTSATILAFVQNGDEFLLKTPYGPSLIDQWNSSASAALTWHVLSSDVVADGFAPETYSHVGINIDTKGDKDGTGTVQYSVISWSLDPPTHLLGGWGFPQKGADGFRQGESRGTVRRWMAKGINDKIWWNHELRSGANDKSISISLIGWKDGYVAAF